MTGYKCNRCGASFARNDNLTRHKKRVNPCSAKKSYYEDMNDDSLNEIPTYQSLNEIPGYTSVMGSGKPRSYDDTASILSVDTTNRIVNKQPDHMMNEGEAAKSLKRKPIEDVSSSPPPKRPKDDRPDIIDCADYITRLDDSM